MSLFKKGLNIPITSSYVRIEKKARKTTTPADVSCYDKTSDEIINIPYSQIADEDAETTTTEVSYSAASTIDDEDEVLWVDGETGSAEAVKDASLAAQLNEVFATETTTVEESTTAVEFTTKATVTKKTTSKPTSKKKPASSKKPQSKKK